MGGEVEAAAEVGGLCEIGDLRGEVGEEAVEAVLFGIDGPDDFVEGGDSFAGGFGEAVELRDVAALGEGDVGEEADLREAGTDLVMHVTSDAGALGFDGGLTAQRLGAASIAGAGDAVADENDERGSSTKREGTEPGSFVVEGGDAEAQNGVASAPEAVVVGGADAEGVVAGRDAAIDGTAVGIGDARLVVDAFELIAEADAFRRDEAAGTELEGEGLDAWLQMHSRR